MRSLSLITLIAGLFYILFGTFCLLSPVLMGYDAYLDDVGYLSLDEIGVYMAIVGAILWGSSLISLSVTVKKNKPA